MNQLKRILTSSHLGGKQKYWKLRIDEKALNLFKVKLLIVNCNRLVINSFIRIANGLLLFFIYISFESIAILSKFTHFHCYIFHFTYLQFNGFMFDVLIVIRFCLTCKWYIEITVARDEKFIGIRYKRF